MISIIIPVIRPDNVLSLKVALQREPIAGVELVIEEDTGRIGCPKMVKKLTEKASHGLVCFLGDDVEPRNGFLLHALRAMDTLIDGWGVIGINDQTNRFLPTHWLADKRMLTLLGGEFFHTGYQHCFCDNELMERSLALGKFNMAWRSVVYHKHPLLEGRAVDGEYARVYGEAFQRDRELYLKRRANGWT